MKAIIIAAGMGKRMKPLTDALPKCMLDLNGKTILETQINILRSCGVSDISVVKGYLGEKITYPEIKYFLNDRFEYNNILNSLFYAKEQIEGEVIIAYSDIIYQKKVLDRLISSTHDISVVVDTSWRSAYVGRQGHPISEAEKVNLSSDGHVLEIGKNIELQENAGAEFIGMMKLSGAGSGIFKEILGNLKKDYWGKPFHEAKVFEKAYLTDMIQELADRKIAVSCVTIQGGWKEIDTIDDYEKAKINFFNP